MAKGHRATFILIFGTLGADAAVLTVNSGKTDGLKSSALTFRYKVGSAVVGAATADVLGVVATSAALTLTSAANSNRMMVIEIDAAAMDLANDEDWLTLSISAGAGSGGCHAIAIIEPRYSDKTTMLA